MLTINLLWWSSHNICKPSCCNALNVYGDACQLFLSKTGNLICIKKNLRFVGVHYENTKSKIVTDGI